MALARMDLLRSSDAANEATIHSVDIRAFQQQSAEPGQISDFQESILADGVVTDDEMRGAVEATLACIRDQGIGNVSVPPESEDGQVPRTILVVVADGERSAANASVLPCKEQFMEYVDRAYGRQFAPPPLTPAEYEEQHRTFAECMRARGFDKVGERGLVSGVQLSAIRALEGGAEAIESCAPEAWSE